MIIVPDDSPSREPDEVIAVEVQKVFDGDGFLARAWNPHRRAWVERIPFRLAFIDAPEMDQPFGQEAKDFLGAQIAGMPLTLVPVVKGSIAPTFLDTYRRVLCVPFLADSWPFGSVEYYWKGRCASGSIRRPRPVTRNVELEMVVKKKIRIKAICCECQ